ncbi:MAG: InlB B-repeat-containing protein [Lachnospiraceae bacterium]|nr:InlB B-repeat-containing protein [Lachnospiraceae bacterium]
MKRTIKKFLGTITAAILTVSTVMPVFADEMLTFDDNEVHTSSVTVSAQVRDYIEYRKRVIKEDAADVGTVTWSDGTDFVRDVLTTDRERDAAYQIVENQSSPAFITGVLSVDDLSDRETDTYFSDIYSEIRNFSAKNYLNMELFCIVSPAEDMLMDDGSHTVSITKINRIVDPDGNERIANVTIRQPFSYDKSRYRLDSVKAIQAYGDMGYIRYNQLDGTDNRCVYNSTTDTLSLKLSIVSPIVILADFHALWTDEVYSIVYYDHNGNRYWSQDILGSNIASNRLVPSTPPVWEDDRYFHDFDKWVCNRDASTAWNDYLLSGKTDRSKLHIDYHPVYKDPVPKITIGFKLPDGTKAAETIISRPGQITLPSAPVSGGKYTGKFLGWKSAKTGKTLSAGEKITVSTSDDSDEYIAQYEEWKVVQYEFHDYNGKVLYKEEKRENEPIIIPPNPSRKETDDYAYEFLGWSGPEINNKGVVIYTAQYNEIKKYLITFLDSDKKTILHQKKYKIGDMPYCPEPSKSGYTFTGWSSKDGVHPVTAEATYIATYKKNEEKKTVEEEKKKSSSDSGGESSGGSSSGGGGAYYVNVVYRDFDGRELKKQTVPSGSKLDPPTVPSFTINGYQYDFLQWISGDPLTPGWTGYAPNDNCTYKASYYAHAAGTGSGSTDTTGKTTGTGGTGSGTVSGTGKGTSAGSTAPASTRKATTTATPTPPAKTTRDAGKVTATPTPSVTPSPWEVDWHKTKMTQDEARIRFIPNEYYGNVTDYTVFDKDLSKEDQKAMEEMVSKQQEEQEKKLSETTPDEQTSSEDVEEFTEPVQEEEEGANWLLWLVWILAGLILIGIIVIVIIVKRRSNDSDVYY